MIFPLFIVISIELQSPQPAFKQIERIEKSISLLDQMPERYRFYRVIYGGRNIDKQLERL